MVVRTSQADQVLRALADGTRRDIVSLTLAGEHSVTALAGRYPMSFAAVQKHVAILERAQLVRKRRHGREQLVRARIDTVRQVAQLLDGWEHVWRARIDTINTILEEETGAHT